MKVLKNPDVFVVECKSCKSELEITKHDIGYSHHFGHYSYLYVECGACGKKVDLSRYKLPPHWQEHINAVEYAVAGDD